LNGGGVRLNRSMDHRANDSCPGFVPLRSVFMCPGEIRRGNRFDRERLHMKTVVLRCIAIGLAGFVGALVRYFVNILFGRLNVVFPVGTMVINLTGSFFLGWFATWAPTRGVSDLTRLAIGTGFVGAYTTFSTYMFESNKLLEEKAYYESVINLFGSLLLGMLAVRLGVWLARTN
jgi:CrcB protein